MFKSRMFITLAALCLMGQSECPTSDTMVIMPLGDSITDGFTAPGSYRVDLYPQMADAGISVDFVGSMSNGPVTLPDKDHEGHSGWRIDQLQDNVGTWIPTYQPERILLIIGTNDILQSYDIAGAPARHDQLVGSLLSLAPNAHVVVASIPPVTTSPSTDLLVQDFNAQIRRYAAQREQRGESVSFVDVYSVLTPADMSDGVHPNRAGHSKIADVFTDELLRIETAAILPR